QGDGRVDHALVAVPFGDLAGQTRTDRAIEVLYLVIEDAAGLVLDRRQNVAHHLLGQLALVFGRIARDAAVAILVFRNRVVVKQAIEVQRGLLLGLRRQPPQQVRTSTTVHQVAHAAAV